MSVLISRRFAFLTFLAGFGRLQNTMIGISLIAAGSEAGYGPARSSAIGGAVFLAAAISAISKGRAVDRRGRGFVLVQAGISAGFIAALVVSLLFLPWWTTLILAAGLGSIRINPGVLQQAIWARYHKDAHLLQRALSMESLIGFVAQTAGPLLAAALILWTGGLSSLVFAGGIAALSMFTWSLMAPQATDAKATSGSRPGSELFPLAAAMFFVSLFSGMTQGLLVLEKGGSSGALFVAAFTFGAGAASSFFIWRGFPLAGSWKALLVFSPLAYVPVFAFLGSEYSLAVSLLLAGIIYASASLAANTQVRQQISPDRLTEGFSVILLANTSAISLGLFLSGLSLRVFNESEWIALVPALAIPISLGLFHLQDRGHFFRTGNGKSSPGQAL